MQALAQVNPIDAGNTLSQWIGNNGLAVVLLMVSGSIVVLAVWRFSSWSAKEIIIPARDRGFAHLEAVAKTMATVSDTMLDMQKNMQETKANTVAIHRRLDDFHGTISSACKVDKVNK
jgi:hypothetical protein